MAWLTNLAGKAEDLLNKLDHNASIVLLQNANSTEKAKTNTEENFQDSSALMNVITHDSKYYDDARQNLETTQTDISESCESSDDISGIGISWNSTERSSVEENECDTNFLQFDSRIFQNDEKPDGKETNTVNSIKDNSSENQKALMKSHELENRNAELSFEYSHPWNLTPKMQSPSPKMEEENLVSKISSNEPKILSCRNEIEKSRITALREREKLVSKMEHNPHQASSESHIEHISKLVKLRDEKQKRLDELNEKFEVVQFDLITTQKQCSLYEQETVSARKDFQKEHKFRLSLEEELQIAKNELNSMREELKNAQHNLKAKNNELSELKKQKSDKINVMETRELESKFHVLTKTLIVKQNALETLTTERNALRLQLEKIQCEYNRDLMNMKKKSSSVLNIEGFHDRRSEELSVMSPFNSVVTRRMKRAFSTLNSFSVRLGVFLRRYPAARVFLLCYMILLQIWVVVILFAYVPGSH